MTHLTDTELQLLKHSAYEMDVRLIAPDIKKALQTLSDLRGELKAVIEAHDLQVTIAKEFQKIFIEVEPQMTKFDLVCKSLEEERKLFRILTVNLSASACWDFWHQDILDQADKIFKEREKL